MKPISHSFSDTEDYSPFFPCVRRYSYSGVNGGGEGEVNAMRKMCVNSKIVFLGTLRGLPCVCVCVCGGGGGGGGGGGVDFIVLTQ